MKIISIFQNRLNEFEAFYGSATEIAKPAISPRKPSKSTTAAKLPPKPIIQKPIIKSPSRKSKPPRKKKSLKTALDIPTVFVSKDDSLKLPQNDKDSLKKPAQGSSSSLANAQENSKDSAEVQRSNSVNDLERTVEELSEIALADDSTNIDSWKLGRLEDFVETIDTNDHFFASDLFDLTVLPRSSSDSAIIEQKQLETLKEKETDPQNDPDLNSGGKKKQCRKCGHGIRKKKKTCRSCRIFKLATVNSDCD